MFAAVSVLTTFSARHQVRLHRQFSSAQFRNEEMMGIGFFGATCCRFVLNDKHLLGIL